MNGNMCFVSFGVSIGPISVDRAQARFLQVASPRSCCGFATLYFLNIPLSAFPPLRIYAMRSLSSSGFKELIRPGGIIDTL